MESFNPIYPIIEWLYSGCSGCIELFTCTANQYESVQIYEIRGFRLNLMLDYGEIFTSDILISVIQ